MQLHWTKKSQEKAPIGSLTIYDAGAYRLYVSENFFACYKILKTESIDESQTIESVEKMPDDWVPFQIFSTEEYPLYSLSPLLEFGSWSLEHASDSQSSPSPPLQKQQRQQHQQRNPTSQVSHQKPLTNYQELHQSSPQQPRPFVKQVQPSSQSHPRSNQHHSKQQQPALRNRDRNVRRQRDEPSSNSTFHEQRQSQHQSPKERQNEQPVLSDHTSLQSQWIPLERLSPSPSFQPSPTQKAKQQQPNHASAHHSTESTHSHEQTSSRQQKSKRPHQRRGPGKTKEPHPQQPKN